MLMTSAFFLAGCGGGLGSLAPRTPTSQMPANTAMHKTFRDAIASGDIKPVCAKAMPHRAHCVAYMLTASGKVTAAAMMRAAGSTRSAAALPTVRKSQLPQGYGPSDLQAAYNLTAAAKSKGNNSTVAIVDAYDDPLIESDLAVYRKMYGLPPCTTANGCFKKVNQEGRRGPYPTLPPSDIPGESGWTIEEALDVDMVSANCPNCNIVVVETNDDFMNNLAAGVNTAASFNPVAISNSYVGQESPTDPLPPSQGGWLSYYTHPGIAVVAGAGDYGYDYELYDMDGMGDMGAFGPLIPADFPTVVTAGGTTLTPDNSRRGFSEVAWGGTGSGCSAYEPMPPWQQADPNCYGVYTSPSGATTQFPTRIYGDVAYDSDGYTGVAMYESDGQLGGNNWGVMGGTSIASPAIAAIYGLAGYGTPGDADQRRYPFPAQKLYQSRGSLYDITSGTNVDPCEPVTQAEEPVPLPPAPPPPCSDTMLYTAGPGYDAPTGNGTPNGIGAF